ncbi:transmembrane 9 superfamily member 11-like [Apium graveolens]|uniref:transmembrane 9 superfamily member 11-like n=1 Tax=Apium graveolens TaxID=4045 RepID=UPI003D796F8C
MDLFDHFMKWVVICWLIVPFVDGFYLPGSFPHNYNVGDQLAVKVNSLTSIDTEIPYQYYSLPFCKPLEGVKDSAENLGELLMGDRIESSPYRFQMYTNATEIFLCKTGPLSADQFKMLKERIDEMYQVNMNLDNLPAIRYMKKDNFVLRWTGYPVGIKIQDTYYMFNHLKFKVLVHKYEQTRVAGVIGTGDGAELITTNEKGGEGQPRGYMVVGFEVIPCSFQHDFKLADKLSMYNKYPAPIKCDPNTVSMPIKEGQPVAFSYEVEFEESDIKWPSRWDAYLKMEGAKVHWFSILNSLMVITFLAGIVLVIFLRTIRRDLARYEELDKEAQAQMNEELSGWKLVVGDVFRAPDNAEFLCVMVADGFRILGMAVATIFFAALGFMSPASRGALVTGMLMFYMFLGIIAGYVAVWLSRTISCDSCGWFSVSWRVACFFPGVAFLILTSLNSLLWGSHSTGAIPITTFLVLLLLWFCISVPLTLLGGLLGTRATRLEYPVRTNQIPREIPAQRFPSWALVLGAGTLPFGTLFIELFFIMSSIWLGRVYYVFGFLFVVVILLVVVCAEVSLVLTYMNLCVEDWRWWWKSFFASGSVALYIFLYSINYLIFDLKSLSGPISATLYLGYSLFMVIAIMLATGAIGFLTSFLFVHRLFSSVKID